MRKQIFEYIDANRGHTAAEIHAALCAGTEVRIDSFSRTLRRMRDAGELFTEKWGNEVFWSTKPDDRENVMVQDKMDYYIEKLIENKHPIMKYIPLSKGGSAKTSGDYYKFRMFLEALIEVELV